MTHLTLAVSGRLPLRAQLKIRESGITGTVPPTLFLSGTHSRRSRHGVRASLDVGCGAKATADTVSPTPLLRLVSFLLSSSIQLHLLAPDTPPYHATRRIIQPTGRVSRSPLAALSSRRVCRSTTGVKWYFNSDGALLKMEERVSRRRATTFTYVYKGRPGRARSLCASRNQSKNRVRYLAEGERCPPDMRMMCCEKGETP